jgi:hypothetical protein
MQKLASPCVVFPSFILPCFDRARSSKHRVVSITNNAINRLVQSHSKSRKGISQNLRVHIALGISWIGSPTRIRSIGTVHTGEIRGSVYPNAREKIKPQYCFGLKAGERLEQRAAVDLPSGTKGKTQNSEHLGKGIEWQLIVKQGAR